VEFEESLLADENGEVARQSFRLLDPLSQKLMGVRADMTMQIGRIAVTRLKRLPRPLRLCYTGTTLHTFAAALKPARQITQAGAELIGVDSVASDAEAITLAVASLQGLGVQGISVDLSLPALVPLLLKHSDVTPEQQKNLLRALANKDDSPLRGLAPDLQQLLRALLGALGDAPTQTQALLTLPLPEECRRLCERLHALVQQLQARLQGVRLTLDATENRGFDYYQKGVSFTLFAEGLEGEAGRGGRYQIAFGEGVPAIGFTLYISDLLTLMPPTATRPRLYLLADSDVVIIAKLQQEGYATLQCLDDSPPATLEAASVEARRLHCQALWLEGRVRSLEFGVQ
jgi:ATP phosphoribosyltransferase regulatory subunit